MKVTFPNLAIRGIAAALPKDTLDISALGKKFGDNEVKRIMASTGIKSIHIANNDMKLSDLCLTASTHLLNSLNITADSIDAIVVVSQTHDAIMPATSAMLQNKIGLGKHVVAFDISYGCSGYIYGLYQASMLISSGGCKRVLLCAGDIISPLLHPEEHQVRLVFGDAVSATIIEKGSDTFDFILNTDGSGKAHLKADKLSRNKLEHSGYIYMNGAEIMEFALREVPSTINELLHMKNWKTEDVGTFVLHQANYFMLNYLRKKMQLTKEAVPIAVENVGNTGPASIPLTLSIFGDQLIKEERLTNVVMCGFGVGLSWAAAGLNLSKTTFLPPVEI